MKEYWSKLIDLVRNAKDDPLKRSMLLSVLCKPLSMIIAFFYTPLLLKCLGDEAYGVWATILSVINWINYFDVGIGLGLRNTLTGYIATDQPSKARKAVSTGYAALMVISGITFIIGTALIFLLDLNSVFNTQIEVRWAMLISFASICINFVLGLCKVELYATQQAEKVSFISVVAQMVNLIGIWLLVITDHGELILVAVIVSLTGMIINIIYSERLWTRFDFLKPSLKMYDRDELKNVCGIGLKFFILQINVLIIFATDNLIISKILGPVYVTPYQTTYNAFGLVNGVFAAFLAPLWSKYTEASEKKDYGWIRKTIIKFDKLLPWIALVMCIGVLVYKPAAKIWLHKELVYPPGLIPGMAFFFFLQMWSNIYTTVLNGVGEVNLQLVLGVISAIVNIPLSVWFGKYCGLGSTGVLLATIICVFVMNILETIQTHRYLDRHIKEQE